MLLNDRLEFAKCTAISAGKLAKSYFKNIKNLTIVSKGIQDMATEADLKTENYIRDQIANKYPNDDFYGEESSNEFKSTNAKGIWVVDPIDGTQPFVNGINSWCISIAYIVNSTISIGVIYDPNTEELFYCQVGSGAYLNDDPIYCSDAKGVEEGLISIGYSNRVSVQDTLGPLQKILNKQGMFHRSGSGALSLAYVAAGRLIGYFEPHMNIWDSAAGSLLVHEAGGKFFDITTNPDFITTGGMALASAPGIYEELLLVCSDD